jgi:hypothetical protein
MKPLDEQLDRLLKAAADAPAKPQPEESFPLEARVLRAWLGSARADNGEFLVAWFRRAALCGCVLAVASLAWNYHPRTNHAGAESVIDASALGMGVEP